MWLLPFVGEAAAESTDELGACTDWSSLVDGTDGSAIVDVAADGTDASAIVDVAAGAATVALSTWSGSFPFWRLFFAAPDVAHGSSLLLFLVPGGRPLLFPVWVFPSLLDSTSFSSGFFGALGIPVTRFVALNLA